MPVSGQQYRIKAIHVAERLRLKELRGRFSREPIEFSNYELIVRYSEDSYLFVYNYGSVVFFNVPDELQERELSAIQEYRLPADQGRATDIFLVEVDQVSSPKVYFDRAVIPRLSRENVKICCMLLAESTALEYYEVLIEGLLERTGHFSRRLQTQG